MSQDQLLGQPGWALGGRCCGHGTQEAGRSTPPEIPAVNLVNTCDKAAKTVCISTWKEAQGRPGAGGFAGMLTQTRLLPVLERALWGPMGPEVSGLVPWEQDVSPECSLCLPAGEMQTQEEAMSGPSDGPKDPGHGWPRTWQSRPQFRSLLLLYELLWSYHWFSFSLNLTKQIYHFGFLF